MNSAPSIKTCFANIDIRIYAVLFSCLFSIIIIVSHPVLNNDAYSYLRAAELFSLEGAAYILSNYGWYGYSLLIAVVNKILPLGLVKCAHLVNIIFWGGLVYYFITLVSEYKNTSQVKILAAILILSFPDLNEMRFYLVRDIPFWTFAILSLLQLIRFHKSTKNIHAIGWCLAMFMAIFFRLEGIVLLVLAPLSILLNNSNPIIQRIKYYFKIQLFLMSGILIVLLGGAFFGINIIELIQFAYRFYLPGIFSFSDLLITTASQLNQLIFSPDNFPGDSVHGLIILIFSYIYIVTVTIFNALGTPLAILFLYGFFTRKYRLNAESFWPIICFLISSIITLFTFLAIIQFLTLRYATLACLLLLSLLPLMLDTLYYEAVATKKTKRFYQIAGFFIFYSLVDSFISFGSSKQYIVEAYTWTQENLSEENVLYTNSFPIAFSSGLIDDYDKIDRGAAIAYIDGMQPGDYLALDMKAGDVNLNNILEQKSGMALIEIYSNNRDNQIRIYRFN